MCETIMEKIKRHWQKTLKDFIKDVEENQNGETNYVRALEGCILTRVYQFSPKLSIDSMQFQLKSQQVFWRT